MALTFPVAETNATKTRHSVEGAAGMERFLASGPAHAARRLL